MQHVSQEGVRRGDSVLLALAGVRPWLSSNANVTPTSLPKPCAFWWQQIVTKSMSEKWAGRCPGNEPVLVIRTCDMKSHLLHQPAATPMSCSCLAAYYLPCCAFLLNLIGLRPRLFSVSCIKSEADFCTGFTTLDSCSMPASRNVRGCRSSCSCTASL